MSLRVFADGPRGAGEVWHDYTHPGCWPTWAPQLRSTDGLGEELRSGSRGVVRGVGGLSVPVRILDVDSQRHRWIWVVGPGLRMTHTVEPTGSGSRAGMILHAPAALAWPYWPFARAALRRLVSG